MLNPEFGTTVVLLEVAVMLSVLGGARRSVTVKLTARGMFSLSNCLPMGEMVGRLEGSSRPSNCSSSSGRRGHRLVLDLFAARDGSRARRKALKGLMVSVSGVSSFPATQYRCEG